jgi:rubredoxin
MAEQRYRCCPECDVERPAAEFVSVPLRQRPSTTLGHWARCPSCGHIAPKLAFRTVDPPAGTEGGATTDADLPRVPVGRRAVRASGEAGQGVLPAARPGRAPEDTLMPKRIYRRCPVCAAVRPALDFKRVAGKPDYGPDRPTRCPECGHVGQHQTFTRVDPSADDEGMGDA